ncbi:transposase [Ralstonia solanacearum]|uniref:Transposase n=4 Tax=Ralstonia solanacearum species complex TaxID=3116862 RepID=A0A0S4W6H9_RALSL|nr:transposase [Ralstonia solanacearum]CAD16347.1 putative transposase remnant protein [Ralstonia pseudosolanacearum GMI1000]NJZ70229.1 transposase [Ralstonia solanacearum]NJZ77578.1 transposase [Ralstonia solanacearum]NJZ83171.1 transposase [Ralstonia solanacearum]
MRGPMPRLVHAAPAIDPLEITRQFSPMWGIWRAFQGRGMRGCSAPRITKYDVTTLRELEWHVDCEHPIGHL